MKGIVILNFHNAVKHRSDKYCVEICLLINLIKVIIDKECYMRVIQSQTDTQTLLISALFKFSHFVHTNFHVLFNYMPTFVLLPQEHCLVSLFKTELFY